MSDERDRSRYYSEPLDTSGFDRIEYGIECLSSADEIPPIHALVTMEASATKGFESAEILESRTIDWATGATLGQVETRRRWVRARVEVERSGATVQCALWIRSNRSEAR